MSLVCQPRLARKLIWLRETSKARSFTDMASFSSRKLVTLSLKRKIEMIDCVERGGKKKKDIASDFGIAPSSVSTIVRDKDRYRKLFYEGHTDVSKKRARPAKYEDVEEALLRCFMGARSENVPLSGPILVSKAEDLAKDSVNAIGLAV